MLSRGIVAFHGVASRHEVPVAEMKSGAANGNLTRPVGCPLILRVLQDTDRCPLGPLNRGLKIGGLAFPLLMGKDECDQQNTSRRTEPSACPHHGYAEHITHTRSFRFCERAVSIIQMSVHSRSSGERIIEQGTEVGQDGVRTGFEV